MHCFRYYVLWKTQRQCCERMHTCPHCVTTSCRWRLDLVSWVVVRNRNSEDHNRNMFHTILQFSRHVTYFPTPTTVGYFFSLFPQYINGSTKQHRGKRPEIPQFRNQLLSHITGPYHRFQYKAYSPDRKMLRTQELGEITVTVICMLWYGEQFSRNMPIS
jgi:hypothetical protein